MNNKNQIIISIDENYIGERLDKAASSLLSEYSRMEIQKALKEGHIIENDIKRSVTPSYKIRSAISLVLDLPSHEKEALTGEDIDFDIVYEDDDIMVIDKPAGLTVHPGAGITTGTLVHALIGKVGIENLASDPGEDRPGILHRLDKDTSGLLLVCKTNTAYNILKEDLANRTVHRIYRAIVWGIPAPREGSICAPIGRNPKNRLKMTINEESGREAVTHYTVIEPLGLHFSHIECVLETGRTHQIRVHMHHNGTPVVGDPLYTLQETGRLKRLNPEAAQAVRSLNSQALHAHRLEFTHPVSGEFMEFESPLPDVMTELIEKLKPVR